MPRVGPLSAAMPRTWRIISSRGVFDLVIYPASLFILPRQEQSLEQARALLKDGGVVAASIIRGIRDSNDTPIQTLSGLPGIVNNDKLLNCLEGLFSGVASVPCSDSLA